ncbi:aldehyde dehydrogenase family protein [Amycolatopsis jiangsuensis]|uniref:Acyl-CoA reductase-like NAD-dependent aldehyde dehydrogenase n=1 Tax=Amycolatopsis jiangsuensis TaxID=1181879 RepID=A0A840J587_9PSEU|nr:aldehyde dehydrogenase family protein [Amycolatopsis jiangsuensis]MBB4688785.1 acyl-CoA reductase-like NAD-dependent aldehyde dehydrogenase [Amycolatopsis jiangsuensis]
MTGEGSATLLLDPRTGQVRGLAPIGDEYAVSAVVAAARDGARTWSRLSGPDRADRLATLAGHLGERIEEYVDLECAGTGKPRGDARLEVAAGVRRLRAYAGVAGTPPADGATPLGLAGVLVHWSYPLLSALQQALPALAAGNAVVVKPAESTPDSMQLLAENAVAILGADVLNVVTGDRRTGRSLVAGPVDALSFAGDTGSAIDIAHGAGLRPAYLWWGGNSPAVVLPGAPAQTYRTLARARMHNAGQNFAPARVITLRENYEQAVHGLADAVAGCRAGADFGPMNGLEQLTLFDTAVATSDAGFSFESGMCLEPPERNGFWRAARVLADLAPDAPAVRGEVPGPMLTVQAAADPEAAVRLANSSPSHAASVWGPATRALEVARVLRAKEISVNWVSGAGTAFGGVDVRCRPEHLAASVADYRVRRTIWPAPSAE